MWELKNMVGIRSKYGCSAVFGTTIYILLILPIIFSSAQSSDLSKEGLCAPSHKLFINGPIQKCSNDLECPSDLKCCDTKTNVKVCAPPQPSYTACQHQKAVAVEIARSIDSSVNFLPECEEKNGSYVSVQCSEAKNRCWCVNEAGFEVPGTRAAIGAPINCSDEKRNFRRRKKRAAPRVCPHPECRMLCLQSFQMDRDGCPICSCYDGCEDIKCPRSTRCITEDVNCVTTPCPPISKCAARAVDDVDCPNGLPALVDMNKKDYFLCSLLDTIKTPKCPAGFDCNVRPNKEFGVCCPRSPENIQKPGQCPILNKTDGKSCVVECQVDQDCYGEDKCCSDNCTALCLPAVTTTPCQAQRKGSEKIPGVFVPSCEINGQYASQQCFGSKCWCVDQSTGLEKFGTRKTDGSMPNCSAPALCAELTCDLQCSHGYKFNVDGCPICSCHVPCEEMGCPDGCNLLELDCGEATCPTVATCKESRSIDHPCIYGPPVRDNRTRDYMVCGEVSDLPLCPEHTKCEPMDAEGHGMCCPLPGRAKTKSIKVSNKDLQITKPVEHAGKCPSIARSAAGTPQCGNSCTKDRECGDDEKCCASSCGLSCLPAITKTACQVHADSATNFLALSPGMWKPQCDAKGKYEEKQCHQGKCWCVDDSGRELQGTRVLVNQSLDCSKPKECGPECRMLCPNGFAFDDIGCSLCECANPCENIRCPEDAECQMYATECVKEPCPVLPHCAAKPAARSAPANPCVLGIPLFNESANAVVPCGQNSIHPFCPVTHECVFDPTNPETSVCCPRESLDVCHFPKDPGPCRAAFTRWYYNKTLGHCAEFIYGGCDGNVNNFHSEALCESLCRGAPVRKPGHCPVPAMDGAGSCQNECVADEDCPGLSKCCSNGCGRQCTESAYHTACDQQKAAYTKMSRFAKPSAVASLFIPQCLPGGAFERMQCDNRRSMCWCVNDRGQEMDGTRRKYDGSFTCDGADGHGCEDTLMCRMDCPFGFLRNITDGCPLCDCADLCDAYDCPQNHECRVMELTSLHGIVSRVPVCAPRPLPPTHCPFGEPLRNPETDRNLMCFTDTSCPSTHKCSVVQGGHQPGVCCSKTSEVCQLSTDTGPCRGTIPRWSFDPLAGGCKVFLYGGCQGNGNNFVTAEECRKVCSGGPPAVALPASNRNVTLVLPVKDLRKPEISDSDLCIIGMAISPVAAVSSNESVELCEEGIGCPLTHSCTMQAGKTICCPKTSDDCFLPFVSGQCAAAIARFHFSPKTKSCHQFMYSGCEANGNNFASEAQCRGLCPVMSQCESRRQTAVQLQKKSSVPVFIPDCDEYDGSWLPVQCLPSLGVCWCVDKNGSADMLSAVRGYPNCPQNWCRQQNVNENTIPLSGKYGIDVMPTNVSAEVCVDGATMLFCDPLLCRNQVCLGNPKSQCRINPCDGCNVEFYDTNNEKVDCYDGLTECQKEFLATMYSKNFAKLQIAPPLMAPGTKSSPNGAQIVRISPPSNVSSKIGLCPPYYALPHEGCALECYGDSQCPGDEKCCFAGCGYTCAPAVPIPTAKPGQCPAKVASDFNSSQAIMSDSCTKQCSNDAECLSNKKCCSHKNCDLVCTDPVVDKVLMPVYLPTCSISGNYEWTQCSGEICWCVEEGGKPRTETVSRGQIQCNESGIMAGTVNPVCANRQKPAICRDTCRNSTCGTRTDVFCAADPCDGCAVRFVDPNGKTVDCHDACQQKMEPGLCEGQMQRYYFNHFTQECRAFNYSGCGGNENNFATPSECSARCLPSDICVQEASTGPCRALIERWFFNWKTQRCEQFDYGGCNGNGNNFATKSACEARCPQITVCPKISSYATVSTCNRSGICEKATCAHPLSECRVDPCTCQAEFVDKWGRKLACDNLPTKCNHESMERSVMADIYHPQCAVDGKYTPLQCFADHFSEKCWCVDEAGNALDQSKFSRGERTCVPVAVDGVHMTVRFFPVASTREKVEESVKTVVNRILEQIANQSIVQSLELVYEKNRVDLTVLLRGERAADVSYFFEKLVNRTQLPLEISLLEVHTEYERSDQNFVVPDRSLKTVLAVDPKHPPIQASSPDLLPLLALLVLFVILAAVIAIFLYRRRRTGSYSSTETATVDGTVKALPNDYTTISVMTSGKTLDHIYDTPHKDDLKSERL